jgi:hypothetical protein
VRWLTFTALSLASTAPAVWAQSQDSVATRIYVVLPQEHSYGYLVAGASLVISSDSGQQREVRTGEDGVAVVSLPLGKVEIAAEQIWRGSHYTWHLPVEVAYSLRSVTLDSANAASVTPLWRGEPLSALKVTSRSPGAIAPEDPHAERSSLLKIMFPEAPFRFYSLHDLQQMLTLTTEASASLSDFVELASRPCTAEACVTVPAQFPAAIAALLLWAAPIP